MGWPRLPLAVACLVAMTPVGHADEFRIESRVYFGEDATEPQSRNLTLFSQGLVYDFLNGYEEVTVLDTPRGVFRLLLPASGIRANVPVGEVTQFEHGIRAWAGAHQDRLLRFLAAPDFKTEYDHNAHHLVLSHELLRYEATGLQRAPESALVQWREYADQFARLNVFTHSGGLPPSARLALNRELHERHLLPKEVLLVVPARGRIRRVGLLVRGEHRYFWRLLDEDQQRLRFAHDKMAELREVPWGDYLEARRATLPSQKE